MVRPMNPQFDRSGKNHVDGTMFAHSMGLHHGNPDSGPGGCISCFTDSNDHVRKGHGRNPDPNCVYCPPKKG
jgi:hypothetical protein